MRSWQTRQRWQDYGVSLAATTAGALVRAALPGPLTATPFLAFYPAVAIAAMRGLGPGLLATFISAICYVLWFTPNLQGFQANESAQWLRLGIFLAGGTGVSLIGHWHRVAQARERQRTEELRQSEAETHRQRDLLAVTLASIGDGVIVTDTQGHVTFLNSEAQRLTGWAGVEAQGQPLASVFKIIHEQTRALVESPADKVLRLGTVVGLANHTVLISKDGRETPIDDSGAPIRSPEGAVRGVVLVFRDFSAQKQAEQALRDSERRVRLKLESILSPEGNLGDLELADLIDAPAIQSLMDRFHELVHIPMAIIDLKGKVLVGVGWQDICTRFHRVHPLSCRHCTESDVELTAAIVAGESKLYKCKNHMWDMATPITVGGERVGNLFIGQFFFDDEPIDGELFRAQSKEYGFDQQQYLAALDAVPRLSRQTVDSGMAFFMKLADMISLLSYGNIKLARSLAENQRQKQTLADQFMAIEREVCDRTRREQDLNRLNRTLRALGKSSQAMLRASHEADYLADICRIVVEDCGHAMVWIGYAEQDEARTVRPVAQAGFEEGYLKTLNVTWADTPHGRGPGGTAIRTGQPAFCRNMQSDPDFAPWREDALKRGYASSLVLPLLSDGKAFGALMIYSKEPDGFAEDEVSLLSELAGDLAHGVAAMRLREARAKSEQSLRHSLQRVELLATTAEVLLRSRQPRSAVQKLCERAMEHLDCHAFFNFFVDQQAGRMHLNACAGISQEQAKQIEWLDCGTAAIGCAAYEGCRIVAGQLPTPAHPRTELLKSYDIKAYACHPLLGAEGEVLGTLSFGTRTRESFSESDLSLMKAMADHVATAMVRERGEEQLRAARRSAEHANQAKNDFLAALSHELRTPLTPVLASVSMLQRELAGVGTVHCPAPFHDDLAHVLEMIHRNVEMEARLIDDLLDVTRIERGKVELQRRPVALDTVIRHAVEVCRTDLETRDLRLAVDLKHGACLVHADAARLQQVFWNLLKNAIKFTPDSGEISVVCSQDEERHILVVVSDNGAGIDPEALPRIFNAFEQAGRETTRQFGGLGLGLTISKAMVLLHGGTLSAHSEGKGKGATFTVRLPMADALVPPIESTLPAGQPGSSACSTGPGRKLRILMVEDHDDTAMIMRRLLLRAGHEVVAAGDVASALRASEEGLFDLLLSDLGLPDGSGLDLMRALRQRGFTLPAIALSGYGQEADIQASSDAGFYAHLVKPVSLLKLEEAIARVVETAHAL